MKKNSPQFREWLIRRNEKKLILRTKKRNSSKQNHDLILYKDSSIDFNDREKSYTSTRRAKNNAQDTRRITLQAPSTFGYFSNPVQTVDYFQQVNSIIAQKSINKEIFFDLSQITSIGVDALIYLLSIIKNFKSNKTNHCRFAGNFPNDSKAKQLFIDSGYLKYFKTNETRIEPTNKCFDIKIGNSFNQDDAVMLCDFVNKNFSTPRRFTRNLYNVLTELMMNTTQHAYRTKDSSFLHFWYIFAQVDDDIIRITFHDNGIGIPNTVKKKFTELALDMVPLQTLTSDVKYLTSAFSGDFRTQTQMPNRGRGLPDIYNHLQRRHIFELKVITGKAYCVFNTNDILESETLELKYPVNGTLYYFEISNQVA